ncbi:MAG: hypothetical protein V7677_13785 [Motiliproteus sp.]
MRKIILFAILLGLALPSWADSSNLIASYCKKQWPGQKGMQSFCIKEKRNYRDWLKHVRKRIYNNKLSLLKMDQCTSSFNPDYRKAYDCYWSTNSSDFPD